MLGSQVGGLPAGMFAVSSAHSEPYLSAKSAVSGVTWRRPISNVEVELQV
jgi:hypothetical protein